MAERTATTKPTIEEIHHRDSQVYICLVLNRKHRSARVVDFLSGNFPQKQAAIHNIAVREGIERVYTLVEREESTGWAKTGYAREGSIPGYYKRSDAHVMGHLIHSPPKVDDDGNLVAPVADASKAEKIYNQVKKLKETLAVLRGAKTELMETRALDALRSAFKGKKGAPPPLDDCFGRTGSRLNMVARDPKAKSQELFASAEVQDCFGNAYLQLGALPTNETEARLLIALLQNMAEELKGREVASAFTYAPMQDVLLGAALMQAGFRKTGLLAKHLLADGKRADSILWARKLINTAAESDAA
ncbi:MAG: hypothetical protein Q8Q09_24265 [Deltaproteobacteria bacterium]|nr:hypothetical protein [Deltaproteobacteria bacterium]